MLIPKKKDKRNALLLKYIVRYYYLVYLTCRHMFIGLQVGFARGRSDVYHHRKWREMTSRLKDAEYLGREELHNGIK